MVFDNCQIDVFFHMRSHYKKLRNVQSVIDCSTPKALKRSSRSDTSFQYGGMAHQPTHSYGLNKHNCIYAYDYMNKRAERNMIRPKTKNTHRPETRRHPEDTPRLLDSCSKSSKLTSDNTPRWSTQKSEKSYAQKPDQIQCHSSKGRKNRDTHSTAVYTEDIKLSAESIKLKKAQPHIKEHSAHLSSSQDETPVKTKQSSEIEDIEYVNRDVNPSPHDHEYLQFLLRITEDIIKNDLYTNKEMKKVFMSHINANKDRLNLDRMLLQIHELMKELSMPFSDEQEEDSSPSWTEIETAMKDLISMEKTKPIDSIVTDKPIHPRFKSTTGRKCICYDIKPLTQNSIGTRHEEVENFCEDRFNSSLDRLTERTEPLSSQATCRNSAVTSCSTFGNVDVLPGFESLETPKVSETILSKIRYKPHLPIKYRRACCDGSCMRRKVKTPKRRRRCRCTKLKRQKTSSKPGEGIKWIESCTKVSTEVQTLSTDPDTEFQKSGMLLTRNNVKPILISFQERNSGIQSNDLCLRNTENDYVLINGPVYLLKAFLHENPNLAMQIELPLVSVESIKPSCINTERQEAAHGILKPEPLVVKETRVGPIPPDISTEMREYESLPIKKLEGTVITIECPYITKTQSVEFKKNHISTALTDSPDNLHVPSQELDGNQCRNPCPNHSKCARLNTALIEVQYSDNTENKLMTNDYDLTPQRDHNSRENSMNELLADDYATNVVAVLLQNFLTTREIQTEHIHQDPTIVATAVIKQSGTGENSAKQAEETPKREAGTSNRQKVRTSGESSNYATQLESKPEREAGASNTEKVKTIGSSNAKERTVENSATQIEGTPEIEGGTSNRQKVKTSGDLSNSAGRTVENYATQVEGKPEREAGTSNTKKVKTIGSSNAKERNVEYSATQIEGTPEIEGGPTNTKKVITSYPSNAKETVIPPKRVPKSSESSNPSIDKQEKSFKDKQNNPDIITSVEQLNLDAPINTILTVPSTETTLTSTKTISGHMKTNDDEDDDDDDPVFVPLFGKFKTRSRERLRSSPDDSVDMRGSSHQRRVSILKNPVVQIPIEKIFSENDDSKKKGESIIKTVEVIKERQANKDMFLNKVLQDIESNREIRLSEKITNVEYSDRSPTPSPTFSIVKDSSKSAKSLTYDPTMGGLNMPEIKSIGNSYDATENLSYEELPIKIASLKQRRSRINSANHDSSTTLVSSDNDSHQNFLPELDEQPDFKVSSNQMDQINIITAKLQQFRHANDRDEREISSTLDKLVNTLKEQQEMEEDIATKHEVLKEDQTTDSTHERFFHCCGFCKKKKKAQAATVRQETPPQQTSFSEQDYKSRSQAFEIALSNLGTWQKREPRSEPPSMKEHKIEVKLNLGPIVHTGNRLSLVRIADERETSFNLEFDDKSATSQPVSDNTIK